MEPLKSNNGVSKRLIVIMVFLSIGAFVGGVASTLNQDSTIPLPLNISNILPIEETVQNQSESVSLSRNNDVSRVRLEKCSASVDCKEMYLKTLQSAVDRYSGVAERGPVIVIKE